MSENDQIDDILNSVEVSEVVAIHYNNKFDEHVEVNELTTPITNLQNLDYCQIFKETEFDDNTSVYDAVSNNESNHNNETYVACVKLLYDRYVEYNITKAEHQLIVDFTVGFIIDPEQFKSSIDSVITKIKSFGATSSIISIDSPNKRRKFMINANNKQQTKRVNFTPCNPSFKSYSELITLFNMISLPDTFNIKQIVSHRGRINFKKLGENEQIPTTDCLTIIFNKPILLHLKEQVNKFKYIVVADEDLGYINNQLKTLMKSPIKLSTIQVVVPEDLSKLQQVSFDTTNNAVVLNNSIVGSSIITDKMLIYETSISGIPQICAKVFIRLIIKITNDQNKINDALITLTQNDD